MIKIIGSLLVMVSSTWYGFYYSKKLVNRPKQIRMLKSSLQSLEAEIMFNQRPLKEAADRIALQMKPPLRQLFEYFSENLSRGTKTVKECWKEAIDGCRTTSAFKQDEVEVLHQFGETLGMHDAESQQKQIQLTLMHLERMEVEAVQSQQQYEKMIKTLGVLTGLLIVIMLI